MYRRSALWCQIDVKEARKMAESHPQWDFHDDEDDEEKKDDDADSESNISSDDEMSDDYWSAVPSVTSVVCERARGAGQSVIGWHHSACYVWYSHGEVWQTSGPEVVGSNRGRYVSTFGKLFTPLHGPVNSTADILT